jgi:hypothetical protein
MQAPIPSPIHQNPYNNHIAYIQYEYFKVKGLTLPQSLWYPTFSKSNPKKGTRLNVQLLYRPGLCTQCRRYRWWIRCTFAECAC